jgi:DNA-binding transcriptional LysR family regulator
MDRAADAVIYARMPNFLAVCEMLSFSRAAERLGIAQPALSRSIRQLEDRLGYRLFERSTRRVALTPAGEILHAGARDALLRLEQAISHANNKAQGLSGTLTIGYSTFASAGPMSDLIIEFRRLYPDVKIGLRLLASSEQLAALATGGIDLGLMMSNVVTADQEKRAFSREPLVVLVSEGHPLASRSVVGLAEMVGTPFVVGSNSRWRGFRALIEEVALDNAVMLHVAEEADDLPVLLQLVRSGFGWTILDASFIPTLPPGIVALDLKRGGSLSVSLVWQKRERSPLLERFLQVAGEFRNRHC